MKIAMIGTRGVPAAYGGFETAVEEVGQRLVRLGHQVLVYTRGSASADRVYRGMRVVHLPAIPIKQLETLSHTGLSTGHAVLLGRPDVAFVFNAANSPFLPLLRARGIPVALHMDGLEWRRSKWGPRGRDYYLAAEQFGVRWADALIADAPGIVEYYTHQFGVGTELIRYGAPILDEVATGAVRGLGLEPGGYHLVVARFEPENHVKEIVQGYATSAARAPLVVVGSAPYSADYTREVERIAAGDDRIRLLGGVWDQSLLDELYAHAVTYLHGHSVGGTNPSLLRSMGAGTAVIAFDVVFNREVLSENGRFFRTAHEVAAAIAEAESDPNGNARRARRLQETVARSFRWDDVAADYERVALQLAGGISIHGAARRARRHSEAWPR